ncbi:hypothetical protein [Roseateles violae]|uniref:Uncharacterized protein n=1 Tax=Roseateles violae TaxID=3058042 RepID=A0ABT8DWR7_9BURK|nr:hypothetical protein [Pelomonas sp. PFR6]MDN3921538.1 hypothetical protein [Pelomonas sp. PFR6]
MSTSPHHAAAPALHAAAAAARVALLVEEGAEMASLDAVHTALLKAGALPCFVGARPGPLEEPTVRPGRAVEQLALEAAPTRRWDALVLCEGRGRAAAPNEPPPLARQRPALDFIREQHRRRTPILALGGASGLLGAAGLTMMLPSGEADPRLFVCPPRSETDPALRADADTVTAFIASLRRGTTAAAWP